MFKNDIFRILIVAVLLVAVDYFYLSSISGYFNKQIRAIQNAPIKLDMVATAVCYAFLVFGIYYFIICRALFLSRAGAGHARATARHALLLPGDHHREIDPCGPDRTGRFCAHAEPDSLRIQRPGARIPAFTGDYRLRICPG